LSRPQPKILEASGPSRPRFAEHAEAGQRIMRDGADRRHQTKRDRQIVMAAFLGQIGRREIDGDAAGRQSEPRSDQRRALLGQESAERALEVAAAGGHNLLMVGPPGAGKSMLASRLPSILPPLAPAELLEVSMVASVAGEIQGGALGGLHARPGEVRNSSRRLSIRSVSRLRPARSRSPAPITASPIRRALCWWRR
jgi:predicted ATPase with chaperone activity